jgi:hypothetical protein
MTHQTELLHDALLECAAIAPDFDSSTITREKDAILFAVKGLYDAQGTPGTGGFDNLPASSTLNLIKNQISKKLEKRKGFLQNLSSDETEKAYSTLARAKVDLPNLTKLSADLEKQKIAAEKAELVRVAFEKARIQSLKVIFSEIANSVLKLYELVHADDSRSESSECSGLALIPKRNRGIGGLDFTTDFFGVVESCEPRQYLSEGHLDSLGLCIYLASVIEFNPPGSLLVLDDVLTSIDSDHRHQITNLIFTELNDYQIIITTHDEVWFRGLERRIINTCNEMWTIKKFDHWSLKEGPIEKVSAGARAALEKAKADNALRYAGGSFRILMEELCQKTAEALKVKMPYKQNGGYTVPDFSNSGLTTKLKKGINGIFNKKGVGEEEEKERDLLLQAADIVLSCSFLNQLSHHRPDLCSVPDTELNSVANNLLKLHEFGTRRKKLEMMKIL